MDQDDPDLNELDPGEALELLGQVDPSSALFRRCRELLEPRLVIESALPPATRTPARTRLITIGMVASSGADEIYSTIQAVLLYHSEVLDEVEFLVVDIQASASVAHELKSFEQLTSNYRYVPAPTLRGAPAAACELIFREAAGEFVICVDPPVAFPSGALARFIEYARRHPESRDLLHGPADEQEDLSVFGSRRAAWPGLNPRFGGRGGEKAYLGEKIRRAGGRDVTLPFLNGVRLTSKPPGYAAADRIRNHWIGCDELGIAPAATMIQAEESAMAVASVQAELASPFHFFDAIYCINLDRAAVRWEEAQTRFRKLGIAHRVRRFAAVETPLSHHIGCALSHRRILEQAQQQGLETVLVFEDDVRFSPEAASELELSLGELKQLDWQLLYLGGYRWQEARPLAGFRHLVAPVALTCTHAIAYHHTVFDAILNAVPDHPIDTAAWLGKHYGIDQFYTFTLGALAFLTCPVIATQSSILPREERPFDD